MVKQSYNKSGMKKTFKNKNYTIANCLFIILINLFSALYKIRKTKTST